MSESLYKMLYTQRNASHIIMRVCCLLPFFPASSSSSFVRFTLISLCISHKNGFALKSPPTLVCCIYIKYLGTPFEFDSIKWFRLIHGEKKKKKKKKSRHDNNMKINVSTLCVWIRGGNWAINYGFHRILANENSLFYAKYILYICTYIRK